MASTSATASHATAPCGSKGEARSKYTRREPDKTVLCQIVRANLEPFLRYTRDNYRRPLPRYVEREFRKYLRCGVLSAGFSRWRCPRCGKDLLVAHSCKGRGLCPSCTGRRMAATALHVVSKVLPDARSPPDEACFIDPPAPDD